MEGVIDGWVMGFVGKGGHGGAENDDGVDCTCCCCCDEGVNNGVLGQELDDGGGSLRSDPCSLQVDGCAPSWEIRWF